MNVLDQLCIWGSQNRLPQEVSKNVRVLERLHFYLLTAGATQRILEYRKKCR